MNQENYIRPDILRDGISDQLRTRLRQCDESIPEFRLICEDLLRAIYHGHSSDFEHRYYSFNEAYPIACCVSFLPYFDHAGERIISEQDADQLSQSHARNCLEIKTVMLNLFPENDKTHVIFTFSKSNVGFRDAVERLFDRDETLVGIGLSNILLRACYELRADFF